MKNPTVVIALLVFLAGCSQQKQESDEPQGTPKSSGATQSSSSIPPHVNLFPKDPIVVVALHPGLIMGKLDYEAFINKPVIAHSYSTASEQFYIDNESPGYEQSLQKHAFLTKLIESPPDVSGIDPEKALHLTISNFSKLEFRILAHLGSVPKFESFIHKLQSLQGGQVHNWEDTDGGHRVHLMNNKIAVAHNGVSAMLNIQSTKPTIPLPKMADKWLKSSDAPPARLSEDWLITQDLAVIVSMKPIVPFLALAMGENGPPPAFLSDTSLRLSLNFNPGEALGELDIDLGQGNELNLGGEALTDELLAILPTDSFLHGGLSIDLEPSLGILRLVLPLMGVSPEEIKEDFGIDFDDLPSLLNGQLAYALSGIDEDRDSPTFVASIGTSPPAAEVYTRIFQKGLLRALRGELRNNNQNPLGNYSITAKGNRLLVATRNHAELLDENTSSVPLSDSIRKALHTPLFNLSLNFPKLVEALDLDQTTSFRNEEYILSELLALFRTLKVDLRQQTASQYKARANLSLNESETSSLKVIAHHATNLANPYYYDSRIRKRMEEAEMHVLKHPDDYSQKIIGTWSGGYQEDGDSSFHRVSYAKDGTMTYEDIWIGEDGYSKDSFKNKWNIHGTTYKEYNEYGGLEWVSSLLNVGDKTMDLLESFGSVRNVFDEEIHQVTTDTRVSSDYQLPEPPEGLEELKE